MMKLIESKVVGANNRLMKTWLADDMSQVTSEFDPDSAEGSMIIVISTKDVYIKNCGCRWQKFGTTEVL